ncbi:MNIO family bufferin maturase [Ensifer sp. 4252]|uniref:MNIO family bufferin maturase n=1 Tax=Ensifer sp. 4252 TaxID=3373915 RepID=UPI003D19138E
MPNLAIDADIGAPGVLRFPAHPIAGLAGTSFKHQHLPSILADDRRDGGFFEVHAENYMGAGGPPHAALRRIREDYPVSLHGVCMSIGGQQPLDKAHLRRFAGLIERYEPALVSEHLAWSTHNTTYYNDLLPLPYTEATLRRVVEHIDEVQEAIRRPLLLENPSTYVVFKESTMRETAFIREIVRRTGCGLLLDVNNVFVSATNHGFSALDYLSGYPLEHVGEIHLAGHAEQQDDEGDLLLIDSHDGPVADAVWKLFDIVIGRCGRIPTLIEWDSATPEWPVLKAEAQAAQAILDRHAVLQQEWIHARV